MGDGPTRRRAGAAGWRWSSKRRQWSFPEIRDPAWRSADKLGPSIATEFGPLLPNIGGGRASGSSWAGIVSQRWDWGTVHLNMETNLTPDQHGELFFDADHRRTDQMESPTGVRSIFRQRPQSVANIFRPGRSHLASTRQLSLLMWDCAVPWSTADRLTNCAQE